jgi:hypothetical protein
MSDNFKVTPVSDAETTFKRENTEVIISLLNEIIRFQYRCADMNKSMDIIWKYKNKILTKTLSKKQAILDCQKELIENGFVGNARW